MVRSEWWQIAKEVAERSITNMARAAVSADDDMFYMLRDMVKGLEKFIVVIEDFGDYKSFALGKDKDKGEEA